MVAGFVWATFGRSFFDWGVWLRLASPIFERSRPQPFVGCDVCVEEPKTPDAYDVSGVFCVGSRAFVRRLLASS